MTPFDKRDLGDGLPVTGELEAGLGGRGTFEGEDTVGLVWTPLVTTSEKGMRSFTAGVIGLVWTPLLRTSEKDLRGEVTAGLV